MKRIVLLVFLVACSQVVEVVENETSGDFLNPMEVLIVEVNVSENPRKVTVVENKTLKTNLSKFSPDFRNAARFYLGTKSGTVQDILYEGDEKIYRFGNSSYKVRLLFVAGGTYGIGEALFQVNGRLLKPLEEKETDLFGHKEFIFVREVWYK